MNLAGMFPKEDKMGFKLKHKLLNDEPLDGGAPSADVPKDEPKTVSIEEYNALMQSVSKLKANNEALVGEKREAVAKRQEEEEARKIAEIESQRKAGNAEEVEKLVTDRLSASHTKEIEGLSSRLDGITNRLITQSKKAFQADLVNEFADPDIAKLALDKMTRVTLDDDFNPVREFIDADGQLITTDPTKALEYLIENHPTWMKGPQSSGGLDSSSRPSSGHAGRTVNRASFEGMGPAEQMKFLKSGGKIK